ncbi:eukaryotic translation initiation factor 4E transporter [Pimephales promelas]|nr:eukaryotic translation initiation factor 4E transporter [Pimephales promelas]KAG1942713.1 eukaryotic translation initiation factor 4E transporter [Pimephales promelas]KAG1942714.1 eukaryotic translation initiation factor 4E transporter [Pimephales promelas]KAG1942716.1 eukaryotic translation initiation factor 4E transporter [Pimephales promelas]KAG1942723.1 eukaryotic translation initiation factor 4E transporter [Pimephales promelas]
MEKDENGVNMVDTVKDSVMTSAYRYTKEELMEIKELPISNERPECLSEKYDSEGVWDPEKWHASLYPSSENSCPAEGYKKDYAEERVPPKRRIADPRERVKDDDLEVVLSPQRRSFGSGCQVAPTALPRRPISPLENKENESLRLGGARRIGSGRITSRVFERDARVDKERERDRERDYKDKRFRRDFGDKRVFSERRRNDSYAEEEPEWFSGGPTSQSETIELIGFDDKILEDDKRRSKRSRKKPELFKGVECNGGLSEDPEVVQESGADQEVPHAVVLPEQTPGEFDFNEFFNLEKTMPGLASQSVDPALVSLSEAQVPASQQKNVFQELLVAPHGPVPTSVSGLVHHRASPPLFPQRAPMQDFFPGMPPATGFPTGQQTMLDQIPDLHRARNTPQMRGLPMGVDQANLEALFQQDLAILNRSQYQQAYNKQAQDKFRNRQTRMNRSPGPPLPDRTSPGNTVTSVLSPSFTPTSVIKKMYESKEKGRDDPGSRPGSKETVNSHNSQEDGPPSPSSFLEDVDTSGLQTGGVKACSTPNPAQNRHSKDPDRPRPPSTTGRHTPPMLSPGPSSPFSRPQMYSVPLLPHVPLVRPPPQLHPGVMQRMLAQGIQPQQLGPTLLQAGMFPQAVDLSQLQGLPPALLGQPLYPLGPAGHPLMAPRAAGTHVQLAVMQQQLQQQQRPNLHVAPSGGFQSQSHGPHRTNHSQRRGGSPTLGLAKWFGSDVLQQPLPSMPSTKVISVDELEFRQ